MTTEQDLVLIYFEDSPLTFARIEDISPDVKNDWYRVKLLILQLPLQAVTWILREAYINGDPFTMDGKRMKMEKVVCPEDPKVQEKDISQQQQIGPPGNSKVISLFDRKRD